MDYMMENCRTCRPVIRHIQGPAAGPSLNYSFFYISLVLLFNICGSLLEDFDSHDNLPLYYVSILILIFMPS